MLQRTYGEGKLRSVEEIKKILGKGTLYKLGFEDKVTAEQAVILNKVPPSASNVAKADDIELQEITERATKSTDDLITQFEGQETLPLRELLALDKQLRSIRGLLKVKVAKKVQLEESMKKESASLRSYENILEFTTMASKKTS